MSVDDEHGAQVDAWLSQAPPTAGRERLVALLAVGFDALWHRAFLTLGEVTLTAIGERVLFHAAERRPLLDGLTVGPAGLNCSVLHLIGDIKPAELRAGIRTVLVEFLTILGRLTAGVLTPALYSELALATVRTMR